MPISRRTVLKASAAFSVLGLSGMGPIKAQGKELLSKAIPKTGELIPVIGIGTNRYGIDTSEQGRATLRATLGHFHRLGGRLIDTAPIYKNSEPVLGELLSELGLTGKLFIATKSHHKKPKDIRLSMQQSFLNLQQQEIDLMQVHSLVKWKRQLPLMRELKQQGRIRYIGVTTHETRQHEELANIMRNQDLDFVQLNYSLADRDAENVLLPLAFDKGIAVIANIPFGRGKLFDSVQGKALPAWAREAGCKSWAQFFLKYIVSHPVITCTIPGTRKEHHLIDNMTVAMGELVDAGVRRRQEQFFRDL